MLFLGWWLLSRRAALMLGTAFDVRSLAQIKLNHCPQQHFSLTAEKRLILPVSLVDCFDLIHQRSFWIRDQICIPVLRNVLCCLWNDVMQIPVPRPSIPCTFTKAVNEISPSYPCRECQYWKAFQRQTSSEGCFISVRKDLQMGRVLARRKRWVNNLLREVLLCRDCVVVWSDPERGRTARSKAIPGAVTH